MSQVNEEPLGAPNELEQAKQETEEAKLQLLQTECIVAAQDREIAGLRAQLTVSQS